MTIKNIILIFKIEYKSNYSKSIYMNWNYPILLVTSYLNYSS